MDQETQAGLPSAANADDWGCDVPPFTESVDRMSRELIGYIADRWTLMVFEELAQGRPKRFGELRKALPGISQKMLTQTLRQMESIGLVTRTIHPVIPPKVEYRRTELGRSLGPVICQLWTWVEENASAMEQARAAFAEAGAKT